MSAPATSATSATSATPSREQLAEAMGLIVAGSSLVDPDTGAVVLEADHIQTFEMAVRACARMHATANQAVAIAAEIQRLQAKLAAVAEWNDAGKRMEEARAVAFAAEVEYERAYHAHKAAQRAVDLGEEDRKP